MAEKQKRHNKFCLTFAANHLPQVYIEVKKYNKKRQAYSFYACLLVIFIFFPKLANAQQTPKTDADKINIQIMGGNSTMISIRDSIRGDLTKLINNVWLRQDNTDLYCDSAYFDVENNNVEAFGNVRITQPGGTQVQSDYLRYVGDKKMAYLKGNVSLLDGANSLYSEDLTYNVATKIATYEYGGTLQADATTLSSNKGVYNAITKQARFTGDVMVTDPQYETTSDDLGYNSATEVVTFYGPGISTVVNEKSILKTTGGTYDTKKEIATFNQRTALQNKEQYIEGDKILYNRNTGYGIAKGNVIAIDTAQHTTMYSGWAAYNELTRILISTDKPVLKQMRDNDSLFIRADTLYSATDPRFLPAKPVKSTKEKDNKKNTTVATGTITHRTTTSQDTSLPRYFAAYHNVKIYSDSLQGRCDSLAYTEKDSVLKLMYKPVVWSRKSQMTGDTILLYMDSSGIRKMYIPSNAAIISLAGPEKAGLYDQVQGKTITGYFEGNAITEMLVWPAAETIYYPKDDSGAFMGVNQSESERMRIFFKDQQIKRILFEQQVKQTITPMEKADFPSLKLSRFIWLEDKRPKSLKEIFE